MKIVVAGYYGFGNAGDELILKSILLNLKRIFPSVQPVVLSKAPEKTVADHQVNAVNRWSPVAVIKTISQCDLFIFGGGGLLQDATGSPGLWYYLLLIWIAVLLGKKIFVCALGVGPVKSGLNRSLIRWTLNRAGWITVRDQASLDELKKMNVDQEIRVTADPVLDLVFDPKKEKKVGEKIKIGLIVRTAPDYFQIVKELARAAQSVLGESESEIVILPFHDALDRKTAEALLGELNGSAAIAKWTDLDHLIALFSEFDLVISMRFHAALLSALMGIPAISVAVDPKIENFYLESFGDESFLVNLKKSPSQNLLKKIQECWNRRKDFSRQVETRTGEWKIRAGSNWRVMEAVLKPGMAA